MARIPLSEVPESGTRTVSIEGRDVLLCRSGNAIHAMDPICPHQKLSLDGGRVRGNCITCPHHGARFSLEDGRSLSQLTPNALRLYAVEVVGEELQIDF